MTVVSENIQEVKKTLDGAESVFILLPQNPTVDATASALSLYLSLKESKKNVIVGCPTQMQVEHSRLVGVDRVTEKIGNRNLIISFDYKEDSIEKVSYNVEGEKFNLVIQPRSGFPPLNEKSVQFSYEGIEAGVMIVFGSLKLENLGEMYEKNRQAFSNASIINIDRNTTNTKYGQLNIVEPKAGSISEMTYAMIQELSMPINEDIAGNLLKGIEAQTNNFQMPFASPETFEVAANLMRAGAKRSPTASSPTGPMTWGARTPRTPFPSPMTRPTTPMPQPAAMGNQPPFMQQSPLTYNEPRLQVGDPSALRSGNLSTSDQGKVEPNLPQQRDESLTRSQDELKTSSDQSSDRTNKNEPTHQSKNIQQRVNPKQQDDWRKQQSGANQKDVRSS